ncbi:MAG: DUF1553 domain-containing protein [Planctomycetes bacterium]|nr:DUF1553 domain-containing protein [Planctomycetota bacterium]
MAHRNPWFLIIALASVVPAALRADEPAPSAAQAEFFEKRIRPLLAEHCWSCHGEKKQEGGLRLDSRDSLLSGGDSGPAVVSGKPSASLLIEAVEQAGDLKMPPAPRAKLSAEALAALKQWVSEGALWPASEKAPATTADSVRNHWAFQPVVKPPVPKIADNTWVRTDIDRFLLEKLQQAGLSPAPQADRRSLLRRASFDLIGLPPRPEEAEAFASDPRPTPVAFETLVDRLLASPHYGERWGRHWLDLARYADNKGYVFFEEPSYPWAYAYREWVIRALNRDLPYDQFVLQQLAADQVPADGDPLHLAALGFLTVGGHFMNNVHDIFDDRIDVVSRGLLGLTVSCARCHDHKYDPVSQADYYALYGVFRSCHEPTVPPALLEKVPETEGFEYYELELAARRDQLERFLDLKHRQLVTAARSRVAEYLLAANASRDQPSTEDFMLLIPEGDLHPLVVQRYWLYLQKTRKGHDPVWAPWHALAAGPESEFVARWTHWLAELPSQEAGAETVNPRLLRGLREKPPQSVAELAALYADVLLAADREWQQALGDASTSGQPMPDKLPDPVAEPLRQVFYAKDAPANVPRVAGWGVLTLLPDRQSQAEFQKLVRELQTWMIDGPHAPPRAMSLTDDAEPYAPRIFLRGNPNRAGNEVPRQFLGFLSESAKPFSQGSGRLELARAIVDPRNPLTARVLVNRVWRHHFGLGLVRTPSDFGVRSEPPSHPELLDYLAATFVEEGWSLKTLHRRIMLSAVYMQASGSEHTSDSAGAAAPEQQKALQRDPENRLLWKMTRRRLDFESLRDSLLSVAGVLDLTVGGKSVNLLAGSHRRSIYGHVDRLALPGLLRTFDFPSPDVSNAQRDETTVAPQALYLLNGPLAFDCAGKVLARPDIAGTTDVPARIDKLYRLLFSRAPTAEDRQVAEQFFGGAAAMPPAPEVWVRYVHALLLTNEFAFVD